MTSSFFKFVMVFLLLSITGLAQHTGIYGEQAISLSHTPASRWGLNLELNARNLLNAPDGASLQAQHLEVSQFTTYESGFYGKVGLGLRYRNRDWFDRKRGNELRLTEQYSYSKSYNTLRVSHRGRFEQRFYDDETVFRLRYRVGVDLPLSGSRLNLKEFYTGITTESLYSLGQKMRPEFDQRVTATFGYFWTPSLKVQVSLEYRLENYMIQTTDRVFVGTQAIIKI